MREAQKIPWALPAGNRCPICGYLMIGRRRPSKDRILPGVWGGRYVEDNIRVACQVCNSLRAMAGHCLGALACASAVQRTSRQHEVILLKLWGVTLLAAEVDKREAARAK